MVKRKVAVRIVLVITMLSSVNSSFAGGIDNLMKFTSQEGTMSNVTKGAIVKDQLGGYMTGGSIMLRGPQPKTLQPLVIQTPKFQYDACSGSADFRFGGLSFVTSEELMRFLKSLGVSSKAYGFKMLLKTLCSQCENVMMDLESMARDINGMMMNQCSAAQQIAGGVYNMLSNSNQQKCMMQDNFIGGRSKDMYDSTNKCKSNPDRYGDEGEEDKLKSLLGNEFNLVWKALSEENNKDNHFKEIIMSISGTVIGRKIDGAYQLKAKSSLILSNDMLERYIGIRDNNNNFKVKQYKCDEGRKCLDPNEIEVTLNQNETLYGNVNRILKGLVIKLSSKDVKDAKLDSEEEALIAFSSIPLINLIEMELATKARTEDMLVRISEFVEVVCYDVVTNFLQMMVTKAESAVEALEYSQINDIKTIERFTQKAQEVKGFLRDARFAAFKRLQVITQVKERIENQERAFEAGFDRMLKQIG